MHYLHLADTSWCVPDDSEGPPTHLSIKIIRITLSNLTEIISFETDVNTKFTLVLSSPLIFVYSWRTKKKKKTVSTGNIELVCAYMRSFKHVGVCTRPSLRQLFTLQIELVIDCLSGCHAVRPDRHIVSLTDRSALVI